MSKKSIMLILTFVLCLMSPLYAANIIWVCESIDINADGTPDDAAWITWLQSLGHTVDAQRGNWTTLDAAKIATLNAADLIMVSRSTSSGNYDDSTTEITQWNSLTKPLIMINCYLARGSSATYRWYWVNIDTINSLVGPMMQVVEPTHPIFTGITLNANNQVAVVDGTTGTGQTSFIGTINVGSGKLLARTATGTNAWIVEWQPGAPFYTGATQTPAGKRLLFCAGTQETAPQPQGAFNLTDDGKKVMTNAINYMLGLAANLELATVLSPADKATDVFRDVVLSWNPGKYAAKHDVYFGTNSADVGSASRTTPKGVLVNQNQDAATYDPTGLLQFGQTYYWRIDEVNAPPTSTVFKGLVWSFTVEQFASQIRNITATASSSHNANTGPEKTVDGSGLTNDQHGTTDTTMWLTSGTATGPAWIQYEFDKVYKLHEMWVWNYNQTVEPFVGFSFKNVKLEYSTDGANWTQMSGVADFAQGTGMSDYVHNTTVGFGGVPAKYVKITANSNWGMLKQYGLSEVRFYYIPAQAREPNPTNAQTSVALDTSLRWRSGREAVTHKLYISTSKRAVSQGTVTPISIASTGSLASYGPLSLDLGKTYFWKVDEVNETATPSTWQGDIWNFTTEAYRIVDNFEDYNDSSPKRIFQTWIDGFGYSEPAPGNPGNGSGSTVGNITAPFAETRAGYFRSGRQAMPMDYNDTKPPYYSEAERTFTTSQDWTVLGIKALTVWFRGVPGSVGSLSYDATTKIYTMTAAGTDIWNVADQFHFAYKRLSGNGSIVAKVLSVTATDPWAKAGVMIRETLDPGSTFAALYMAPANGCRYQARLTTAVAAVSDSTVTQLAAVRVPHWIKIERNGNTFSAYDSNNPPVADGGTGTDTWHPLAWNPQTIQMGTDVYIGLAVTSHNATATCTAQFSNVSTAGTVTPAGVFTTSRDIGIASNAREPLYVAVTDSAGKTKAVTHPDPNAVLKDTYQEWNIPLKAFSDAGVNLKSVKKLAVGAGNKASPTPGGAGELYFDDIRLYPARCLPLVLKPGADLTNDCAVDYADIDIMANDWLLADSIVTTAAPSAAGLVRHFKLDGNTDDSSTNAANGVAMGMPTWTTAGKIGGALVVDGVNDWVETSYATDLTAWTVAVWVKSPAAPANAAASGPLHREQNYQINWNHTNPVFRGGAGMQVGTTWYAASFGTLLADTWYHLAATYDGETLRTYKNGALITANTTPSGNPTTAGTTTLKLGRYAVLTQYFTGTIDDARVYNQVLTAAQVAYLADTTPADGQLQIPVDSAAELYSAEPAGSQKVNLKDFAKMAQGWLEELLWPQ